MPAMGLFCWFFALMFLVVFKVVSLLEAGGDSLLEGRHSDYILGFVVVVATMTTVIVAQTATAFGVLWYADIGYFQCFSDWWRYHDAKLWADQLIGEWDGAWDHVIWALNLV